MRPGWREAQTLLGRGTCTFLFLAVSACSGGGGRTAPALTPTPTPTDTPVLSPTAPPPPTATATPRVEPSTPPSAPTGTETGQPHTPTQRPTVTPSPTQTVAPSPTPSPTTPPTATPVLGPIVTALGVADLGGQPNQPTGTDPQGRPIFTRTSEAGFLIFVEGRPGLSQLPPGTVFFNPKRNDPQALPDLIVQVSRALGDGSEAVCDVTPPRLGGVPGSILSESAFELATTDAVNDFACRFRVFTEPDFACTLDVGGNLRFREAASTVQYCVLINDALTFPPGDTIVRVRLRDIGGNVGSAAEMVVRVP